ncbi:TPA: hypothetical protein ACIS41_001057, partial [Salmonella enterica subsp. diarizonae serovar 50:k:z35]
MALSLLAANNAQTVLAAGISSTATSLTVNTGTGELFPSPVAGTSFFKLTIIDAATGTLTEIVHVSARNGDVFTIQRAQEGTTARAWSANDIVANMMTAGTLSYILGNFQPLDPTLTALASLVGGADKLPYFTGNDTAGQTDLTSVGRDIIGKASIADILTYLQLEETVKLAANALSAKIVGEVTNNGTMASANKPGWWRIAVADTDTVADFPAYPVGSKLYGYGMMFVEVIDGTWLQHYYAHNGHNAKRQDWATSITANVPWVVDYNTSNPQRDIAGNAATATTANAANTANVANTATTATKLKTPRTIAGVAFDGTTNIDLGFLGYGQLLSDVTASRVKNVSYTNYTSKPVVVYVRFNNENNINRKIYVN